jgi:hypothetical protein
MRDSARLRLVALLVAPLLLGSGEAEKDEASPLQGVDLSGDWYVLIHYKDDDSVDKSITKFKDVVWSIQQTENTMTWEEYHYVMFPDGIEFYRRAAMENHTAWEPDDSLWDRIRVSVDVSSRGMKRKRLTGSRADGFSSLPPITTGGFQTMTYTTTWKVAFKTEQVRIEVTDSLGGSSFQGMEGATLYEVTTLESPDEFTGRYDRDTLHGTFRMVRSKERKVVK